MHITFQVMVLVFIRDWYQLSAQNSTGEVRDYLMKMARDCERLADEITRPLG